MASPPPTLMPMGGFTDASSEWLIGTDRYAATAQAFEQNGNLSLFEYEHDAIPAYNPLHDKTRSKGTQVLLRKTRDGEWQLLLDGQLSTDQDQNHTLPKFKMKDVFKEDSTKRNVPAPVLMSCMVEVGACKPDLVKLQVIQRSYSGPDEIHDIGDVVVSEIDIPVFTPGDHIATAITVAYPVAFGKTPRLVLTDNRKARESYAKDKATAFQSLIDAGTKLSKTGVDAVSRLLGAVQATFNALTKATGGRAFGYMLLVTDVLLVLKQKNDELGLDMPPGQMEFAGTFIFAVSKLYYQSRMLQAFNAKKEIRVEGSQTHISMFNLSNLLERVMQNRRGGTTGEDGSAFDLDALRSRQMYVEALMEEHLAFSTYKQEDIDDIMNSIASIEELASIASVEQYYTDEDKQALRSSLQKTINRDDTPNPISVDFVDQNRIKEHGYVETMFRIEIIDSKCKKTRVTIQLKSKVAFAAGLVSLGYKELIDQLSRTNERIRREEDEDLFLVQEPLQKRETNADLIKDLVNLFANKGTIIRMPNTVQKSHRIQALLVKAIDPLKTLYYKTLEDVDIKQDAPQGQYNNAIIRQLPQRIRIRNTAGVTFSHESTDSTSVDLAEEATRHNVDPLKEVLAVAVKTFIILRNMIHQFAEVDGLLRPRMRLFMALNRRKDYHIPRDTRFLSAYTRATRLLYAPRLPDEVLGAIACRSEHIRHAESLAMEWINRVPNHRMHSGASMALKMGLLPNHMSELVVGAVVDLATDDVLSRMHLNGELTSVATSSQRMESALAQAVRRVKRAGELASSVFDVGSTTRPRLGPDDAFFECFPYGDALARVLRETPMWRLWVPFVPNQDTCRFETLLQEAKATPKSVTTLKQLIDAMRIVRLPTSDVSLFAFPYLSIQTLGLYAALGCQGVDSLLRYQINHAKHALDRVNVLSECMQIEAESRLILLFESAYARPVLTTAVAVNPDLLDVPALSNDVQPKMMNMMNSVDAYGYDKVWMNKRVESYRIPTSRELETQFDEMHMVDSTSRELETQFDEMHMVDSIQYMIPFAGGLVRENSTTVGRAFEDTPVWFEQLVGTLNTLHSPLGAELHTFKIMARSCDDGLHPLVIVCTDKTASIGIPYAMSIKRVKLPGGEYTASMGASLLSCTKAASRAAIGKNIDATSTFVYVVERIIQAMLFANARGGLGVVATPLYLSDTLHSVPKDEESDKYIRLKANIEIELYIAVIMLAGKYDAILEKAAAQKVDLESMTKSSEITEMQWRDILAKLVTEVNLGTPDQWRSLVQRSKTTAKDVDKNRVLYCINALKRNKDAAITREKMRKEEIQVAEKKNTILREKSRIQRRNTLVQWVHAVVVGHAIASLIIGPIPLRILSDPNDHEDTVKTTLDTFHKEILQCLDKKLMVVPLSELAAVLVHKLQPQPSPPASSSQSES